MMINIKRKIIAFMVLGVATAVVIAADRQPKIFNTVDKNDMETWVDTTMRSMTIDEKIGQLIVMQTMPDDSHANFAVVKRNVEEYKIGGLLFTKGDIMSQKCRLLSLPMPSGGCRCGSKMLPYFPRI